MTSQKNHLPYLVLLIVTYLYLHLTQALRSDDATEFCSNLKQTISYTIGDIVSIRSPSTSASNYIYDTNQQQCVITLRMENDQRVGFHIVQRRLGKGGDNCFVDFYLLTSTGSSIPRKQTCSSGHLTVQGHHAAGQKGIKLWLIGKGAGFELNFTALPLHIFGSDDKQLSTPSGYIISDDNFRLRYNNTYSINSQTEFQLNLLAGVSCTGEAQIVLQFIYFNLGRSTKCTDSGDMFILYEYEPGLYDYKSGTQNQLFHCGDRNNTPTNQMLSISPSATSLIFEFKTGSSRSFGGFFIKYKVISYTKTVTIPASGSSGSSFTLEPDATADRSGGITTTIMKYGGSTTLGVSAGVIFLIINVNVIVCVTRRRSATTRKRHQNIDMRNTHLPEENLGGNTGGYECLRLDVTDNERDKVIGHRYSTLDLDPLPTQGSAQHNLEDDQLSIAGGILGGDDGSYERLNLHNSHTGAEATSHRHSTVDLSSQTSRAESNTERAGSDLITDTTIYMNVRSDYVNSDGRERTYVRDAFLDDEVATTGFSSQR